MACAVVWRLQRSDDEPSETFKAVLVRLSGKRVKRGHPLSPGILLSGLFVLLRMLDFLNDINFDTEKINQLKTALDKYIPGG